MWALIRKVRWALPGLWLWVKLSEVRLGWHWVG